MTAEARKRAVTLDHHNWVLDCKTTIEEEEHIFDINTTIEVRTKLKKNS
jgi:hypothetical protein